MSDPIGWLKGAAFAASFAFRVSGKPVPCPRPRVAKFGVFYPKNYCDWRTDAQQQITTQLAGSPPLDTPVVVAIEAVAERPKSTILPFPKADTDNYAKSVMDALTKATVWSDDSLVQTLLTRKRWAEPGEEPGFNIWIAHA